MILFCHVSVRYFSAGRCSIHSDHRLRHISGHARSVEGGEPGQSSLSGPDTLTCCTLVSSWCHAGWEPRIERIVTSRLPETSPLPVGMSWRSELLKGPLTGHSVPQLCCRQPGPSRELLGML